MGGGHSIFFFLNPWQMCPGGRPQTTTDQKPTGGDITGGITLQNSKACKECKLTIDASLSSASAKLFTFIGQPGIGPPNYDDYSMTTKIFLLPSLPFSITFNGTKEMYPAIQVYRPSPIRIGNIQHDAVIQIGSFKDNSLIILVPLISTNLMGSGSSFVGAFVNRISEVINPNLDASGNRLPTQFPDVPTGSDWTLDKIVDDKAAFFTWSTSQYEQYMISTGWCGTHMGWRPIPPGQRIIYMQDPVSISSAYMTQLQTIPVTDPNMAIHGLGPVAYKSAPPKNCTAPLNSLPEIPKPPKDPFAAGLSEAKNANNALDIIIKVIIGLISTLAIAIGVYAGFYFASHGGGEKLAKLGEALGQKMAAAGRAAQAAAAKAGTSARSGIANVAGIGKKGAIPPKRTPIEDTPLPEPTDKFVMTNNPMIRNTKTRRYIPEDSPLDIHPGVQDPTENIIGDNPLWKNKVPDSKKKLTRRNASRDSASPLPEGNEGVIPALSATGGPLLSPDELDRRNRAERYRLNNPAGTGLFDLSEDSTIRELNALGDNGPLPGPTEPVVPTQSIDEWRKSLQPVRVPSRPEKKATTPPPPPPPGTHGLWRNGVSLSNLTRGDDGPLPAANEPVVEVPRRPMTVNADATARRNALLAEDQKDDSPLPTPSESNRSLASAASVASRLSRRASRAREAAADFDLAVERTPTRPAQSQPVLEPPLPTDAESRASSASLDRALERARAINPDTGFTNSTSAKMLTANAFSTSLRRVRKSSEPDRSMTAQELAAIGAPKRTRAEKLALRREGKKAGRRKTGRRNI